MSFNGLNGVGDGGGYADPFADTPQESSMTAPPPRNDLKIVKKRSGISGGHRAPSFGLPRHRAPSTSATTDFAMDVARVASIGNTSSIAENDEMDVDTEDVAPTTLLSKRPIERTPLEPIMNDLQIDERSRGLSRPAQPVFGKPWGAPACPPHSVRSYQSDDDSFESFGQRSPSLKSRSLHASFDGSQRRPVIAQPAFGSFQSDASTSFSSFGRPSPIIGRPSMDDMGSMRSVTTDFTAPSPFSSLRSEKAVLTAPGRPPMMIIAPAAVSAAGPKWTHEEDRFLKEMYDKYESYGLTGPISLSASGAPPYVVTKVVTRNAMAYWHIANFEKSESLDSMDERLKAQNLPTRLELADWLPSRENMQWIVTASEWRHERKSTERRLSQLVSGRVEDLSNKDRVQAASAETASENLASMFSLSDSNSTATGNSIPLGSMTRAAPSSSASHPVLNSMPPPSLPVRPESRNVEMQIEMGVRTTVTPNSLPPSYRAPGASAVEIGRAVKSLRGVPGVIASNIALDGATNGQSRQSQSLSAATGNRALGSALTFGPPLSSTKGKKRSREECVDAEYHQRHNGPSNVARNSEGFHMARKEDDMFGPPSLRDDRSLNGKRQNRARSHTLLGAAVSSDGGNASVKGRNMADFKPRGLDFNSGAVSSFHGSSNTTRGSNHAPSSSMPASLSAASTWGIRLGNVEPVELAPMSIAQKSCVRQTRSHYVPSAMPAELAPGSMAKYLPKPNAEPTPERRTRDARHLEIIGQLGIQRELNPETRRDLREGGLPLGVAKSEVKLLSGIEPVETFDIARRTFENVLVEQYDAIEKLKAQSRSEREAAVSAEIAENKTRVASFRASRNIQPALSAKNGTGMEGIQMS